LNEALTPKDKEVINTFYSKETLGGKLLSTDGKSLEKHGLGGQTIAVWKNNKIVVTAVSDVKSTDTILNYMKKSIPKLNFDKKSWQEFFEEVEIDEKFAGWIAFYGGKQLEIKKSEADGIWPAKQLAIKHFKVPKSKLGLLAIAPAEEEVEVDESDGYEVDMAAKKIQHKWKKMSKSEKIKFLDKMDVLAGKTKVSDSDLEDILGDYGLYKEASGDKEAYQKFFNGALKKFGVKSPSQLKGDKKKEFFDYIDKNWTADHEEETKKEETMAKKSLKDVVSNMKEKKLKVQEAITIGGVEVGEQDFDKEQRLDHAAPNLGMTYNDYQSRFETNGLEGPYQIDGGAYFWDKMASKWFSVETEDYVDGKRNAELSHRYTKGGTAGGGLLYQR